MSDLDNPFGDLPENVSSESRRNIIANTLPGLLLEDYSITQAYDYYKGNGLGIRYSDFRDIWRNVTGEMAEATRIQYVRGNAIPSDAILRVADTPLSSRYRMVGEFYGFDNESDERQVFTFAMDFNEKDTIDSMLEQMFEEMDNRYPGREIEIDEGRIIRGYIQS